MLKINFIFIFTILITSVSLCQTADEVIDNYISAIGGIDKIKSIKTVKINGHYPQGSINIPFVEYIKVPDKIKIEVTRQGLTSQTAYDGTIGWRLNPFRGVKIPEKITAENTKDLKKEADFEGELIDYRKKGSKAEYLGIDDFEGSDVYKIKLTDSDGEAATYFIDKVTNLILKKSVRRKIKEKEQKIETVYSVYKSVDGYLMPFSIESAGGAVIDKVEFNLEIDDGIFNMPEEK